MKLYVCWDAKPKHTVLGAHPCGRAHEALVETGHDPEVVLSYGWAKLPGFLNRTRGRRDAQELTGSQEVPVTALDDGVAIGGSKQIMAWAKANPAGALAPRLTLLPGAKGRRAPCEVDGQRVLRWRAIYAESQHWRSFPHVRSHPFLSYRKLDS